MREIERKRVAGVKGRLRVKVSREMLVSWVENFIDDFNDKKTEGVKNRLLSQHIRGIFCSNLRIGESARKSDELAWCF